MEEVSYFDERDADELQERLATLTAERDAAQADVARLRAAVQDMLSGWRYIRQAHGDLYGVGWDRAQIAVEEALAATATKEASE